MGNLGETADAYAALSAATNAPALFVRSTAVIGGDSTNTGIAHVGYARTVIEGGAQITAGSETADAALFVKKGDVTINGGTFYCGSMTETDPSAVYSGVEHIGSALAITSTYNHVGTKIEVDINGGSFTSAKNGGMIIADTLDSKTSQRNLFGDCKVNITDGQFIDSKGIQTYLSSGNVFSMAITGGVFSSDPSPYVTSGYEAKLINGIYYVGEPGDDDDTVITEETETAEDGTVVNTEAVIVVNSSGNVSRATVTIETDTGSEATARIGSTGTVQLVSDTNETIQLSDKAVETIVMLAQSA
jgi:hypothetical protein